MSQALPAGRPARVLIEIEDRALARWVLWLAAALERRPGTQVRLRIVAASEKSTALATLLSLEAIILRRHKQNGADRIAPAEVGQARLDLEAFPPDLVIDVTDRPAPASDAVRLRPLYDGVPGETALASALFHRGTPRIEIERIGPGEAGGRIVAAGTASLEAASGIGGGMEAVASRVITLLSRALAAGLDNAGGEQPCSRDDVAGSNTPAPAVDGARPIRAGDVYIHSARSVARAAVRAAYDLCCHGSHWRVGWRFVAPGDDVWSRRDLAGEPWNVLADPVDHFYADPFPLHWQGRDFILFEDLDHKTEKGIIAAVAFDENGVPGPAVPVIEEPWHLSYPFLLERDGGLFMIPESSASREITLYRAVDGPLQWERHATLVADVEAADATIVEHDGLLYLFAVVRDGIGGYSDTLAIWWAHELHGPWHPHAQNPVLVDDRTARPAGNFVQRGGALYRPVQDCRHAYGGALGFMKVTRLDREGFAQESEGVLAGGGPWPGKRLHTLNYNGRLEVIDGYTLRPKLKAAADLVDWWYRPPRATGPERLSRRVADESADGLRVRRQIAHREPPRLQPYAVDPFKAG
jgi:hypothetical protein